MVIDWCDWGDEAERGMLHRSPFCPETRLADSDEGVRRFERFEDFPDAEEAGVAVAGGVVTKPAPFFLVGVCVMTEVST